MSAGSNHCTDIDILRAIDKRARNVLVRPSAADLVDLFHGAESTARKHIARLVGLGLVERVGDRSEQLALTARGKKAAKDGK